MPAFLIVDQDPRFASGLRSALEAEGWPGKTTTDAREAAQLAVTDRPQLLLASVEVDGARVLLERFSQRAGTGCSSIAFVPAARAAEVKAEQLGADGLLPRPCTRDQFWSMIRRVLSEAQRKASQQPAHTDSTKLTSAEIFGDLLEEVDSQDSSQEPPPRALPRSAPVKIQLGQQGTASTPADAPTGATPAAPEQARPASPNLGDDLERKLEQTLSGVLDLGAQKSRSAKAAAARPIAAPTTQVPAAPAPAPRAPVPRAPVPRAPAAQAPPAQAAEAPVATPAATPTAAEEPAPAKTGTAAKPRRRDANVDDLLNQTLSGLVDLEALGRSRKTTVHTEARPATPTAQPEPPAEPPIRTQPKAQIEPIVSVEPEFTTMKLPTGLGALAAAAESEAEAAAASAVEVGAGQIEADQVEADRVEADRVEAGQVEADQVEAMEAAPTEAPPEAEPPGRSSAPIESATEAPSTSAEHPMATGLAKVSGLAEASTESKAEGGDLEPDRSGEPDTDSAAGTALPHPMSLEPPGFGSVRQDRTADTESALEAALKEQAESRAARSAASPEEAGWFDELVGDESAIPRTTKSDSPLAAAGRRFGSYTLVERIAIGGMAEVWKARMSGAAGFQKIVAIKKILSHLTANLEFEKMFVDEAKLAAQLNHPNITQIYDLGQVRGEYYIAMEYVDGKDLRTILDLAQRYEYPLGEGLALLIASRLASGLDHAHRRRDENHQELGLVHRDVSPQNVLIGYEGDVKLCDFGIVKAVAKASQTQMGALKGKLQYMSPEQAWGKTVDARTDLFSVGALLFEMLTGRRLFAGDSELSVLEAVRECRIEEPRALVPEISQEVNGVVLRALAKEPEDRFQTAAALRLELDELLLQVSKRPGPHELSYYLKHLTAVAEGRQPPPLLAHHAEISVTAAGTDSASAEDPVIEQPLAEEAPAEASAPEASSPLAETDGSEPETAEEPAFDLPSWEGVEAPEFDLSTDEEPPLGAAAVLSALEKGPAPEVEAQPEPPSEFELAEEDTGTGSHSFDLHPMATGAFQLDEVHEEEALQDILDLNPSTDDLPEDLAFDAAAQEYSDIDLPATGAVPEEPGPLEEARLRIGPDLQEDVAATTHFQESNESTPSSDFSEPAGTATMPADNGSSPAAGIAIAEPAAENTNLRPVAQMSVRQARESNWRRWLGVLLLLLILAAAAAIYLFVEGTLTLPGEPTPATAPPEAVPDTDPALPPSESSDDTDAGDLGAVSSSSGGEVRAAVLAGLQDVDGQPGGPLRGIEVQPPKLVNIGKAQYPRAGRQHDLDGHVVLALLVDPEGKVEQVRVLEELEASPSLVQLALDLAAEADFLPARSSTSGNRIRMWTQLRIAFES